MMMLMRDEEVIEKLEESTKNAQQHQFQILRSILLHNASVHYLQSFNLKAKGDVPAADPTIFTRLLPLSSYEDYIDYIEQMVNGKQDPFLSIDPLLCFFYSSGTSTMKPKLIPYFDSTLSRTSSFLGHRGSVAVHHRLFPPRPNLNKNLWFLYADNITTTKCGLKVMAASSYALQSGKATAEQLASFSSPQEVFLGSNVDHQMYCHLLCGLRNLDVLDGIRTPYVIGLIQAFTLLESKWGQLCEDLDCGFPCHQISDVAMREAVTNTLGGPQPELSNRIRVICEGKNWRGIVSRLFPNVRFIKCVTTGSMKQYYQKLKYYAGDVPILGGDYFASECCVGINLDIMQPPETTRFVILPTAAYFEFLPFDMNENNNDDVSEQTVGLCNVEVGKMYEVVVTTFRGFYRYKLGDVVRVVGFHNSSPQVEFVMRAPNSSAEVITERDLFLAVDNFQLALRGTKRIDVVDFASFLDQESIPKKLKVFVEVEVEEESNFLEDKLEELVTVFKSCISSLENGLGALYKVQRDKGHLGNLVIFILKPGAFDQLLELAIKNGSSASQYKPPKIIRNHEVVKFLENVAFVTISLDG